MPLAQKFLFIRVEIQTAFLAFNTDAEISSLVKWSLVTEIDGTKATSIRGTGLGI